MRKEEGRRREASEACVMCVGPWGTSLARRYIFITAEKGGVARSFMAGTTRTGRDDSREGCTGATSTREMLRVLPQPTFLCDTASR